MLNSKYILFIILFTGISLGRLSAQSEIDSTVVVATDSIKTDSVSTDAVKADVNSNLLPDKYLFTQKLLWGKKGLMRNFKRFELSEESRDFEENIRNTMFKAHRYIGYATLVGMVAEGIVGERLYNGHRNLKDLHEGIASAVNIGYFSTAGLALFAPPPSGNRPKGFSTYKLHRYLAVVHLSSMIATNILSGMIEGNPGLKPYHRAAAYTAFGSFFASMIVIQF